MVRPGLVRLSTSVPLLRSTLSVFSFFMEQELQKNGEGLILLLTDRGVGSVPYRGWER